jgi:hypothetical protein
MAARDCAEHNDVEVPLKHFALHTFESPGLDVRLVKSRQ